MAVKGTLTNISIKQGNTNGRNWKLYTYKLDNGKSFTAFKKFNVSEGDYVEITNEQKNGKWQVKDIKKINNPSSGIQNKPNNSLNPDRELYIQRQSSLKVATDIVANNLDVAKIITIADLLVEYCQNGKSEKLEEELSAIILNDIENIDEDDEEDLEGALDEDE